MAAETLPRQSDELAQDELAAYTRVLNTVRDWPLSLQINLAQSVLTLIGEQARPPKKRNLSSMIGRWKADKPAPTDEEVAQMLEDIHLARYYGTENPD